MAFGSPLLGKLGFNILDYGARGGGQAGLVAPYLATSNDTAIQNAAAAAFAAGGGTVIIPNDRFYTSSTFTLTLSAGVNMAGQGVGPYDVTTNRANTGIPFNGDPIAFTQGPTLIMSNTVGQSIFFGMTTIISCYGNQMISDIIFALVQPVPAMTGTYTPTQYPWAISAYVQPNIWLGGLEVARCMIYGAWKGLQLWGGRNRVTDTAIESFNTGLKIDGTADITYISGTRHWPLHNDVYGSGGSLATMNSSVYIIANNTAMLLMRCDEIVSNNIMIQCSNIGIDILGTATLTDPGPFGLFQNAYIETCNICVRATRTAGNGVQFMGGAFITTYTSPTQTNNTWLQVLPTPVQSGVACNILFTSANVGGGPVGTSQTYLPDIQGTTVGRIVLRDILGYNMGGVATGPLARITQTNSLPATITVTTGLVITAPQGNAVTYYINGPPGPNTQLTVAMQQGNNSSTYTQIAGPITNNACFPVRLGPGLSMQITTNLNTTAVPVGDF